MKGKLILIGICVLLSFTTLKSQDTFSIVAIDTVTGEVGSAGASCVDMNNFPGLPTDFLGELLPGLGAINTQAWYQSGNQLNARNRMLMGDTPSQIISWLVNNDVQNQPQLRQYGIVALVNGSPQSAGHTGSATDDYKNHVIGPNYSIQGNILLGQQILDSMETRFLNAPGNLACKLMAALQGANVVGADTRCAPNGSSSLFAFVKVAEPNDFFGNPSFKLSIKTSNGSGIEPIDSLQSLFNNLINCATVGLVSNNEEQNQISIFPNPVSDLLVIQLNNQATEKYSVSIVNAKGVECFRQITDETINIKITDWHRGVYYVRLINDSKVIAKKIIKY